MNDDGECGAAGRAPGRSQAGPHPRGGSTGVPVGRGAVASPCISVCRMHAASGWCEGCLRTLAEIAAWSTLDDAGKRSVWKLLPARRAALALQTKAP